ncbi:MAG: hypothetical protein V1733_00825 [bacterium]
MKKAGYTTFILLGLTSFSFSQSDHYWAQQYGAQSTLMGGAMIGGVRDNSAIYYNPGAFTFIDYPSLSVNANLYKIDEIFIDDGAGDGINLNSAQLSIYPQIISGMSSFKLLPRFQFAYCLLTRNFDNILMKTQYTDADFEVVIPDIDAFIGEFDFANQLNEQWFGLGIGYQLSDKLGIGITTFGTYRSQVNQMTNLLREIRIEDSTYRITTVRIDGMVKYRMVQGLFKIGLAYASGSWKLGLTVTTPSFRIYGKGDIEREVSLYSLTDVPGDTSLSFIIADHKSDVRTYYKHPWSLGAGVEYGTLKTRIALSAEYFFRVRSYKLMDPTSTPFIYPPSVIDSAIIKEIIASYLLIDNESKPVCNIGIGLEQYLWKKFSLLAGFHTDFSNYKRPSSEDILLHSSGPWDLYHFSAGLSYHMKTQVITAGFYYAFSPTVRIEPFTSLNPLEEITGQAKVFPQTFAFIIGYTYLFPRN